MFLLLAGIAALAILYLYHVNRGMCAVPAEALALSPRRWTVEEIKAAYDEAARSPVDVSKGLPPKQNRRYIVVGGSGESPVPLALISRWGVSKSMQLTDTRTGGQLDRETPSHARRNPRRGACP